MNGVEIRRCGRRRRFSGLLWTCCLNGVLYVIAAYRDDLQASDHTCSAHSLFRAKLLSLRRTHTIFLTSYRLLTTSQVAKAELTKIRQTVGYGRPKVIRIVELTLFTAQLRTRRSQYPRSRTGTLEEAVCSLDSGSAHRRSRSREGSLGRTDNNAGPGCMAEEPSRDPRGQSEETVITECLHFSDKQGDSNIYPYFSSPPLYERATLDILGAEIEDGSSLSEDTAHCFNCGSIYHFVSSCSTPHNVELIALSRQMYNFFKPSQQVEQTTVSAAAEYKRQRHQWIGSFEPGQVRGPLLCEALGLRDDDVSSDAPWFKNMADWGYPSGWYSEGDPREQIMLHIDSLFVEDLNFGEGSHSLAIFGDDAAAEVLDIGALPVHWHKPLHPSRREDIGGPQDPRKSPDLRFEWSKQDELGRRRRWATYPSTYFSSDLLPVYNGARLPPVLPTTSSTFTTERHLLWKQILNDDSSPRIRGLQDTANGPQPDTSPPPPPTVPAPPLPPSPLTTRTISMKSDDAALGAHMLSNASRDGESDMELSDSDT
jgi:zinc finger CCHC domain-containing protein 8